MYYDNDNQVKEILQVNNRKYEHYIEMLKNQATQRLDILSNNYQLNTENIDIIDIGGGTCEFGDLLHQQYSHLNISILEPGITRISNNNENITYINSIFDNDFVNKHRKQYNIVTAFHVVEHTLHPIEFVSNLYKLLKPNGLLYIEVPNQQHDLIMKSDYYRDNVWYCKAHISYFTIHTMKYILEQLNITNYTFHACQRYDYTNYMHWITYNKPQDISSYYDGFPKSPEELTWINQIHEDMTTDSFYVIICKK
jgi:2-polyprenyl-3-methyl-5-hydroxy-6-metoxy-1,4-benzoquinol methylase